MSNYRKLSVKDVCDIFENKPRVLFLCHRNPDGDTLGSALAMWEIASLLGSPRCACASCDDAPGFLSFMTGRHGSIKYESAMENDFDMFCAIDVASPNQLGSLDFLAPRASLMIDHHSVGAPFCDNLVCPESGACGEIIFEIYRELLSREKIHESAAVCRYLYCAVSSDTGSFKFANTTAKTHEIAAYLTRVIDKTEGLSSSELSKKLHDTCTYQSLLVKKAAIDSLKLFCGGKIASVCFTSEMQALLHVPTAELGNIVDLARNIEDVLVGFSVKQEAEPAKFSVSMRSNCRLDVAAVCSRFGGGGHERAAGCTITADSPDEAVATVLRALEAEVCAYEADDGAVL